MFGSQNGPLWMFWYSMTWQLFFDVVKFKTTLMYKGTFLITMGLNCHMIVLWSYDMITTGNDKQKWKQSSHVIMNVRKFDWNSGRKFCSFFFTMLQKQSTKWQSSWKMTVVCNSKCYIYNHYCNECTIHNLILKVCRCHIYTIA